MLEIAVVRPRPPLYEWKEITSISRRPDRGNDNGKHARSGTIIYKSRSVAPDRDTERTLEELFSPAAPVTQRQLFAGRQVQMDSLLKTVNQVGEHAVVVGERGVGKTSLAKTMFELLRGSDLRAAATCLTKDSFTDAWRKALGDLKIRYETQEVGFASLKSEQTMSAARFLPLDEELSPNDVKNVLEQVQQLGDVVIVMDEFDRLADPEIKHLFAETMKLLSDWRISATLILVGVAANVEELIMGHASVDRGMAQILVPRMSREEMEEIIRHVEKVGMSIAEDAQNRITRLSRGLPHYTHLLTKHAALSANNRDARLIELEDVEEAMRVAIRETSPTIAGRYRRATTSSQKTLYPQVLLACALVQGDELGYFPPSAVQAPLSAIRGKRCETRTFSKHLSDLSDPDGGRGSALQKTGSGRTLQYRFANPLLQPFVILKAFAEGTMDESLLQQFSA